MSDTAPFPLKLPPLLVERAVAAALEEDLDAARLHGGKHVRRGIRHRVRHGEAEHVAQVEREQREPRAPDDVLEKHHRAETRPDERHYVAGHEPSLYR